ncbi:MAG: hypothetical protein LBR74_07000 [Eubacterium sp.]|nr:hypothetical protein [Eubacterium sp.]
MEYPEWTELTGKEFLALVRSPEMKSRYFIKLDSACESDSRIVMEATENEYRKWRKEKDHSDYIRENNKAIGYKTVSYHAFSKDEGEYYGEELLSDGTSIEADYFKSAEQDILKSALARLSEDELNLITFLFLSGEQKTDQEYSDITGIPRRTVAYRKAAVLQKLKKFFES